MTIENYKEVRRQSSENLLAGINLTKEDGLFCHLVTLRFAIIIHFRCVCYPKTR